MRKIYFENEKKEIIDDSPSKAFESGTRAYVYHYKDDKCLKLCLQAIRSELHPQTINSTKVNVLKRIRDLDNPYIYQINDFFRSEYDYASSIYGKEMFYYAGYTMKYYNHYQNDTTPDGKECFNILKASSKQTEAYFNQVLDAILYLSTHHFEVKDLHRRNIVKGKDKFTIIDCDEYGYIANKIPLQNNIKQLGMCFADLLSKGLYYSFDIGYDSSIKVNDTSGIYGKFIKPDIINYQKFNTDNMYNFLDAIKSYNTPEEYFEDHFNLTKRQK